MPPDVSAGACLRNNLVVAARTGCTKCKEACPIDAITLDPVAIDPTACDGCGRCVPTCPSYALAPAPAPRRRLISALGRTVPSEPFRIACAQAAPHARGAQLEVTCLASVPWEVMAAPALLGAKAVRLAVGDCDRCMEGDRSASIEARRALASDVCQAAGAGTVEFEPCRARPEPRDVSRRGFFSGLLRRGQGAVAQVGASASEALLARLGLGGSVEEGIPWLRETIVALLSHHELNGHRVAGRGLAARLEIDEPACDGCGLCAAACPTSALRLEGEVPVEVVLDAAGCSGCGACASACRPGAVALHSDVALRAWTAGPAAIAHPPTTACRACGGSALSAAVPWCAPCYRMRPPLAG